MREMSSWSAMVSSTTESSVSFRDSSIASSFSACGTVRGNPSSTKLATASTNVDAPTTNAPVLALLVVLELVPDHTNHNVIRDEPARIHDLFRLDTERRLLRYLLA